MCNVVSHFGTKSILFLFFFSSSRQVSILYGLGQRILYGNTNKKVFDRSWEAANEFTLRSDNCSFGEKIDLLSPMGAKK